MAPDHQPSRRHHNRRRVEPGATDSLIDTDDAGSGLLLAADYLERWAESLPSPARMGEEPWYEFADRRYRAEVALMERLRRAPRCHLWTCPVRMEVNLTLGGSQFAPSRGSRRPARNGQGRRG